MILSIVIYQGSVYLLYRNMRIMYKNNIQNYNEVFVFNRRLINGIYIPIYLKTLRDY